MLRLTRKETVAMLIQRDGSHCMLFNCGKEFNEDNQPTIDHVYPQSVARREGWPEDKIESLKNKQLLCRRCNTIKNDLIPNDDGTINFPPRRSHVQKQDRVAVCETCYSGRLLLAGEVCEVCDSVPQPQTAPAYLQVAVKDCDHDQHHCHYCYVGIIPRKSALESLISG